MSKLEFDEESAMQEYQRSCEAIKCSEKLRALNLARWQHAQDLEAYQRLLDEAMVLRKKLTTRPCSNTGYYGQLNIRPGACKCRNCEFNKQLKRFDEFKKGIGK